ncbi:MAG: hypothetical protein V1884_04915 [Candidatus Omnitrophota bacterium]
MEKIRYEVDPHNRLLAKKTGKVTALPHFRRVLDGQFKAGKNNSLTYHIKSPIPQDIKSPHQVKLKGSWSLTKNHDLRFTLDKWRRQTFGDQLTLEADIVSQEKNALLFSLTTRTKDGNQSLYLLRLEGVWQADKYNRLTFKMKKGEDEYDILTFEGAWQIDKNHQIIYRYQKERLVRKLKRIQTLIFKGYWDINDKARISYIIDKDSGLGFDFKTSLGIFKNNYIKYELGIGRVYKQRPARRVVILSGRWKIKKDKGLVFEVERDKKKVYAITFGAEARLTGKDSVVFKLKGDANKELGAELELSRKILKGDGQAFLRLLKSKEESAVLIGAGRRW